MKLISNDLRDGDKLPHRHVFNGMGYDGDNISPHLAWDDVPAGTKSFVVTCYDPDAPTGSGWWHWVVVNLPADTRVLPQGFGSGLVAMPDGVLQTRTDFGKNRVRWRSTAERRNSSLHFYRSRAGYRTY
ncbi:putative phosphatidylethanolamine-binding protein [Escherichia coli]|nr:putative phosphatidylethanolamine-binding protein [Escherichia coli]